jgi:hypothetical protein
MKRAYPDQHPDLKMAKARIAQTRRAGGKRHFPSDLRATVVALHDAGLPVRHLAEELNLSPSIIYGWLKQPPTPNVFAVTDTAELAAPQRNADGILHLSVGGWKMTISAPGQR